MQHLPLDKCSPDLFILSYGPLDPKIHHLQSAVDIAPFLPAKGQQIIAVAEALQLLLLLCGKLVRRYPLRLLIRSQQILLPLQEMRLRFLKVLISYKASGIEIIINIFIFRVRNNTVQQLHGALRIILPKITPAGLNGRLNILRILRQPALMILKQPLIHQIHKAFDTFILLTELRSKKNRLICLIEVPGHKIIDGLSVVGQHIMRLLRKDLIKGIQNKCDLRRILPQLVIGIRQEVTQVCQ